MTMLGYQNKVLRINLTEKKASTEPLRMDFAEKYVGSKGLVIRYMYEELQPGIDALGPDNKLFLTTGPFTGTPVPCSGKLSVAAKSPATGTMNDCSIGGHAGIRIKFAGYDMIIFEGQLAEPGYVVIEDDEIKFVDAGDLWGKGSHEAESILSEEYGREFSILSIGPAGENLSNMACINSDYYRQAGRGGIGAVMGSKKMKAILVKGTGGVKVPDIVKTTDRILEILHEDVLQEDNTFVYDTGTTAFLEACNDGGILPWKNFSDTTDEQWTEYNGDVLMESREGKRGCGSCGLGCGNFLKIGDAVCEGPEYETISVAGPNAGIRDPYAIVKFNLKIDAGADTADFAYIVVDGARHGLDNLYNGEHAVAIPLVAGDHEITIAYRKDATDNTEGTDAAYMSKVTVEKAPYAVAPTPLEIVAEMPEKFEDAEQLNIDDLAYVMNGASKGTTGDAAIIYIKKSHDYPRASIKFTVEKAGTYEILVVTALKNRPTAISTGIVQVDDGQKYYLSSPCKGIDGEPEYFVGITVELTAGEHDFHMFLAEDFNDGDVKSIYFDYIFVVEQ